MRHLGEIGIPATWLDQTTPHGILASFDGAFRWIDHPSNGHFALIGDAAATTDPVWGNGLSRSLRDVRLLRDRLLNDHDWFAAAIAYARDHDEFYRCLRLGEQLKTELFFATGAAGEARRQRVFALMRENPKVSLDISGLGPEFGYDEELASRMLAL
jgi:menaquinone-9 beta-reductase